jgi:enoyl-CoA hydratase
MTQDATQATRFGPVALRVDDGVATVQLDDPEHRNALSRVMSDALAEAVAAAVDADAGAIVLTASPPVFCAGGSLDGLLARDVPLAEMFHGMRALAGAPVPTIAAVAAPAIGAGVNLPLACDVVLAGRSARFDPRFLDVGIHPGGGHLWRLRQRIGAQGAAALVLCGDVLTGDEAVVAGLAWRCVDDGEVEALALRFARRAAGRDRELVRVTKRSLRDAAAFTDADAAAQAELVVQQWSMDRPGFDDRIRALQARLAAQRDGARTRPAG